MVAGLTERIKELSLFTGAGGGVWASKLLNHQVIGYVEYSEYCQKVIRARIDDGSFDSAPIFTDVREFVESGAARQYRGFADVVSGGFPCQPFSVAGIQQGENDERNMWPATCEVVRQCKLCATVSSDTGGDRMKKYKHPDFKLIVAFLKDDLSLTNNALAMRADIPVSSVHFITRREGNCDRTSFKTGMPLVDMAWEYLSKDKLRECNLL